MNTFQRTFLRDALQARQVAMGAFVPEHLGPLHTDTRSLASGQLFLALVGERFDAHTFLEDALRIGASSVIVERARVAPNAPIERLIVVDDTLLALQDIARAHLHAVPARRLALTGSNGKTTTKELAAAALRACYGHEAVWATRGNLNNHIGVPLTALEVTAHHRAVIFEMGMNHLGEIATLTRIVQPDAGLITQVGTAHAGNVGGIDGVERAKGEIFAELPNDAIAIVNLDDPRCVSQAQRHAREHQITFGTSASADVRIIESQANPQGGTTLTLAWQGIQETTTIPLDGTHNARNAAGAVALCLSLGVDFRSSVRGLADATGTGGRLQRRQTDFGTLILDDTYNANPDSMEAGLQVLAQIGGERRRVAALGEMREVDDPMTSHLSVGRLAAGYGVARLFACGELGKFYIEGATAAGMSESACVWAQDSTELAHVMSAGIDADDVVLVKGSRGARMEIVVDDMMMRFGSSRSEVS